MTTEPARLHQSWCVFDLADETDLEVFVSRITHIRTYLEHFLHGQSQVTAGHQLSVRYEGCHCRNALRSESQFHCPNGRSETLHLGASTRMYTFTTLSHRPPEWSTFGRRGWKNPDLIKFPEFGKAGVHEVVLQAGDALDLPTFCFHWGFGNTDAHRLLDKLWQLEYIYTPTPFYK